MAASTELSVADGQLSAGRAAPTPSWPPALRSALSSATDALVVPAEAGGGVQIVERAGWKPPAIDGDTRSAAETQRDALIRRLAPANYERLAFAVSRLLAHHWRGRAEDITTEAQQALQLDWVEDLAEYPEWAIDSAFRTWRRCQEWAPTIAGVRALCEAEIADDRRTLRLLGKLLTGPP